MSSSPPPTKKFFLKPSALKVPSSSLGVAATEAKDELAKEESTKTVINTPTEESDLSKGSLLRPSALKVQTQTPQEIKPVESPAIDSSKITFPPLTPPEEAGDKSKTSPIPSEPQNDNSDKGKQVITNGHKASSFVFGERLEDRVTITEQSSANPTKVVDAPSKPKNVSPGNGGQEAKADNQESGSKKRPFEVLTGEEDESNVLQIHCKLYQWETSDAVWREKGNGSLKLNDRVKDGKLCSRLVMRTSGNLKVILNSSLVVGMSFSKSNEKSLRFTNVDGIYTVKGKEKDIELLFSAVDYRLRELAKKMKGEEVSSEGRSVTDAENTEAGGCIKPSVDEDESNSGGNVVEHEEHENKSTSNSPKDIEGHNLQDRSGGCFNTIREHANLEDLSN